jgi:hypothetical protein
MIGSGAEYPIARITIDYLGVRQAVDESKRALAELQAAAQSSGAGIREGSRALGELTGDSAATAQALAGLRGRLDDVTAGMAAAGRGAREDLAGGLKEASAAAEAMRASTGSAATGLESAGALESLAGVTDGMEAASAAAVGMGESVGESMDVVAAGMSNAGKIATGEMGEMSASMGAASAAAANTSKASTDSAASLAQLDVVAAGMGKSGRAALDDVAYGMSEAGAAAAAMRATTTESMDAVALGMSKAGGAALDEVAYGMTEAGASAAAAASQTAEMTGAAAAAETATRSLGGEVMGSMLKFVSVGAAIREVVSVFHDWMGAIEEAEQADAHLNAMIQATGDSSGIAAVQVREMATALEGTTLFKSEDVEQAAALLMTFTSIRGDVFARALKDATDLGQQMGSLSGAARSLGFALESPEMGMARLRRAGIKFTDEETAGIKALQEAGNLAGAQVAVLDAIDHHMAGIAAAAHTGIAGELHDLSDAWKNMLDSHKDDGLVTAGIGAMTAALQGLTKLSAVDTIRAQFGALADQIDEVTRRAERAGMLSPAHPQDNLRTTLAFEQQQIAANHGQLLYPGQEEDIGVLRKAIGLQDQWLAINHQVASEKQKAADAGAAAAAKDKPTATDPAAAAGPAGGDRAAERNYTEGMDQVRTLAQENMALREHATDLHAAAAEQAYLTVLEKTGDEQLAEMARTYTLDNEAIRENARATEELARKKAEAAARVAEYVQRLNEEADALAAGGKAEPSGHAAAMAAAGFDPVAQQSIIDAESRVAFYKAVDTARQDDLKREEGATQTEEKLWNTTLTGIAQSFTSTFDQALSGKVKSFQDFCADILKDWSKTMGHLSSEMLHADLSPKHGKDGEVPGPGEAAGGVWSWLTGRHIPTTLTEPQRKEIEGVRAESALAAEKAIPASEGGFAKPTAAEAAAQSSHVGTGGPSAFSSVGGVVASGVAIPTAPPSAESAATAASMPPVPQQSQSDTAAAVAQTALVGSPAPVPYAATLGQVAPSTDAAAAAAAPNAPPSAARDLAIASHAANAAEAAAAAFGAPASAAGSLISPTTPEAAAESDRAPGPSVGQTSGLAAGIAAATPFLKMAAGALGGGPSVPQASPSDMAAAAAQTQLVGPSAPGPDLTQTMAPDAPALSAFPMFHAGGVVGDHASHDTKWAPVDVFGDAPRFHSGLGGDEFPAILQRGERVLTERHQQQAIAAADGAGADATGDEQHVHVHFNISAMDGRDVSRLLQERQGDIVRMVGDAVRQNRSFAKAMAGT